MSDLTRPIIGIENRTPQEVFDIMCDRITRAPAPPECNILDTAVCPRHGHAHAAPLMSEENVERVAIECHHASCANVPRHNPDYSRDSHPWEHCPSPVKDAWRAIARAAILALSSDGPAA